MKCILVMLVTTLLLTRANCQPQLKGNNEESHQSMETRIKRQFGPGLDNFKHHTLLDWVGLGRTEVNSALKVLGTVFNFVDIYGRPRYPVMDSNTAWFRWVDRNLPLVMSTYMAPTDQDPQDVYLMEEEYHDDYIFAPYYEKSTPTSNVIWQDFYKQMYLDTISPNRKSSRSGATSRQGFCLDGMYPGYSSVEVDVMGQTFKYLLDSTVRPVYEIFARKDNLRANMVQVDPLYKLWEHLTYFVGLSEGEDTYSFYESRIDAEDRSVPCVDSTARIMSAVMPYGPVLTLSNLVAVGVWLMAFIQAPFFGL